MLKCTVYTAHTQMPTKSQSTIALDLVFVWLNCSNSHSNWSAVESNLGN